MEQPKKYKLKEIRLSSGLTLTQVATDIGVHRQSLWLWENIGVTSSHSMSSDAMLRLSKYYSVPVEEIVNTQTLSV